LTEQFLVWEGLERNHTYKLELLIKELLAKNQLNRASFHIKKMQQNINSATKSFEDYMLAFKVEEAKNQVILKEGSILKQDNFSQLEQQLDSYYLIFKLKTLSSILSIQNITAKPFTFNHNSIQSLQKSYQSNPLINAYILSNEVQQNKQEKAVNDLLQFLKNHFNELPNEELSNFYRVVCNFYVEQMIRKNKSAKNKLSALYKQIEPKNLLFNEDIIQIASLVNIISLSCQTGDFLWATHIYEKYHLKIEKLERKNFEHLFSGIMSYYKGNYQEAKTHLFNIKTVGLYYKLFYRMLQIKVLYETDKYLNKGTMTIFESQISFYNRTTLMNNAQKTGYKNFITSLKKLYKARHSFQSKIKVHNSLEKLRKKLSQQTYNVDEEWLLKKLDELKQII